MMTHAEKHETSIHCDGDEDVRYAFHSGTHWLSIAKTDQGVTTAVTVFLSADQIARLREQLGPALAVA